MSGQKAGGHRILQLRVSACPITICQLKVGAVYRTASRKGLRLALDGTRLQEKCAVDRLEFQRDFERKREGEEKKKKEDRVSRVGRGKTCKDRWSPRRQNVVGNIFEGAVYDEQTAPITIFQLKGPSKGCFFIERGRSNRQKFNVIKV